MASLLVLLFACVLGAGGWSPVAGGAAATFGLDFHHRFSDRVRQWAESRGALPGGAWPETGTAEYYAALAYHDRARLRGRALAAGGEYPELAFVDGNETVRVEALGFLHYAVVALGTPNVTFLVALDTGSDLFWVPCDCQSCAPTTSPNYRNLKFDIYNPSQSSTSKQVSCNSSFCGAEGTCSGATGSCAYMIEYVSANTSSSGILVQDILYLTTEGASPEVVKAPIVFGCGQVQTGSFLDAAAPNGLLGLGLENVSVPSILSSKGLTSDSFSMCFGNDGIGRINFGDKGSSDQQETPFYINPTHPAYNISITGMTVGNTSINGEFSAIVDSGTSFTLLADPMYTQLATSFDRHVKESRYHPDPNLPFEYCYSISSSPTEIELPGINLTTKGGSQFPAGGFVAVFPINQIQSVYCLAIAKSRNLSIIGQNFMTGLRVVFDRERMILGWERFNCYDAVDSSTLPVKQNSSALPPSISFGPSSYTPEATTSNGNSAQKPLSSHATNLNPMKGAFLVSLLLLPMAFL